MKNIFKNNLETTVVNSHNHSARSRSRKGRSIGSMHAGLVTLTTFSIALLFSLNVFSQAPAMQWQKCLGGTGIDIAHSIAQTTDGGYVVAGGTVSNDGDITGNHGSGFDYWVVKLDVTGAIQWQKCLGGTAGDVAYSVAQTMDGGYVAAGQAFSNDSDVTGNHGLNDYWIVKLDSAGIIQWQKCLGGQYFDGATSIVQTVDGGYVATGSVQYSGGDITGPHGSYDYWVVKLDGAGAIQWQKCLGGSSYDFGKSIQQTSDGGYVVAGNAGSVDGDVTGHHGSASFNDFWIVKLDGSANIQWKKCLGGIGTDEAHSIVQTFDGGYIVAGGTTSTDGDVTGNHGNWEYWLVKLDGAGTIQWQKCLGGTAGDEAYSVAQTIDGGYIVAGRSKSTDGDITGNHGDYDYWVVKLDGVGAIQWQKCLGGTGDDEAYSITPTTDGGYVMTGYSGSYDGDITGNHGGDYWVVKLATDNVGIKETDLIENNISLSPNPFHETATLTINTNKIEEGTIEIKNILGIPIAIGTAAQHFTGNKINLQRNNLPAGIYFYHLTTKEGMSVNGKFVIN